MSKTAIFLCHQQPGTNIKRRNGDVLIDPLMSDLQVPDAEEEIPHKAKVNCCPQHTEKKPLLLFCVTE